MIFVGDIAVPHNSDVSLECGGVFHNKCVIANLEGCMVGDSYQSDRAIYNGRQSLELLKRINCAAVGLANNHIQDAPDYFRKTIDILNENNIAFRGIENQDNKYDRLSMDGEEYYLLNYAWIITGIRNQKSPVKVMMLRKKDVLNDIKTIKSQDSEAKILCFFHWGYELETFPLPMDRDLARNAIDLGAYAVIGCHSHCLQGVEIYKGRPIVYGLGNFFFPEGEFFGRKLVYPEIAHKELAFEIKDNEFLCHWFIYDVKAGMIRWEKTTKCDSKEVKEIAPYVEMDKDAYLTWFKKNRRKKKLLPVFASCDHEVIHRIKIQWVEFRQRLIHILFMLGIKRAPV